MNGVGIGMEVVIRAAHRLTLRAHLRGITACYAAGAGAVVPCICVQRTGMTTIRRTGTVFFAAPRPLPSLTAAETAVKIIDNAKCFWYH